MSNQEAIALLRNLEDALDSYCELNEEGKTAFRMAIEALSCSENPNNSDCISRKAAIDAIRASTAKYTGFMEMEMYTDDDAVEAIEALPSAQPDLGKYEYHYDHTDCIWYRPEARNRCPVTCAQYRDGWNDAMNYIFRDGKGYRPYRRGEQYGE